MLVVQLVRVLRAHERGRLGVARNHVPMTHVQLVAQERHIKHARLQKGRQRGLQALGLESRWNDKRK